MVLRTLRTRCLFVVCAFVCFGGTSFEEGFCEEVLASDNFLVSESLFQDSPFESPGVGPASTPRLETPTATPTPAPPPVFVTSHGHGGKTLTSVFRPDYRERLYIDTHIRPLYKVAQFRALPRRFASRYGISTDRSTDSVCADFDADGDMEIAVSFGPGGKGTMFPSIVIVWSPFGEGDNDPVPLTCKNVFCTKSPNPLLRNPHGAIRLTAGRFINPEDPPLLVAAQGVGGSNQIRLLRFLNRDGVSKMEIVGTIQGLTGRAAQGNGSGGTSVAAGDVDDDGLDELIVGQMNGEGAETYVQVVDLEMDEERVRVAHRSTPVHGMREEFQGLGGVNLAVGDVLNEDGASHNEIIVASAGAIDAEFHDPESGRVYRGGGYVDILNVWAEPERGRVAEMTPTDRWLYRHPVLLYYPGDNPSGGLDIAAANVDFDEQDEFFLTTQAILNLDRTTGEVTVSHSASVNLGVCIKFEEAWGKLSFWRCFGPHRMLIPAHAASSGALSVSAYGLD